MPQNNETHPLQMKKIRLEEIPDTSRLYKDYVNNRESATYLFANPQNSKKATLELSREISKREYDRKVLSSVLLEQNQRWGAKNASLNNCRRLERQDCLAVVTGQQVGFLGGPLYSIVKALHAIKLAAQYEKVLSKPVVPIFWLELEDHDLEEVNHINMRNNENRIQKLTLGMDKNGKRKPVNRIRIGESLLEAIKEMEEVLPETEFSAKFFRSINSCYNSESTLADGFARFFAHLLSRQGLVLADPSHYLFKSRASQLFVREIEKPLAASAKFRKHEETILSRHYHNQVNQTQDKVSIFLLDGEEKLRINKKDKIYYLNDPSEIISREDLIMVAQSEPERLIPSALLRPLVQDTLFPTLAYVAGPAEVAYLAQLKPVYSQAGIPMPIVMPRAGITIVGGKARRSINTYNIETHEIFQPSQNLLKHILSEHVPSQASQCFKWTRNEIREALNRLKSELDTGEGNFSKAAETTEQKIDYHLGKLQDRYLRELERRNEVVVKRIEHLSTALYPNEKLQERVYSIVEYFNLFGPQVINAIYNSIDPVDPAHMVVEI